MSIDDKINEALGISNTETHTTKQVIKKEFTPPVPRLEDKEKQDIDNDYKYSRENYYKSTHSWCTIFFFLTYQT